MKRPLMSEEKKSQYAYISYSAFSYIPFLLIGGTFLVDLLKTCGLKDGAIGIVSSIGTFLAVTTLLVLFVGHKIRSPKKAAILCIGSALVLYIITYIVALLPMNQLLKQTLVVGCLVVGLLLRFFVGPIVAQWRFTFIPTDQRGKFTAANTLVSLLFSIVCSPLLGYMRDYFHAAGKVELNYAILAIIVFVMDVIAIGSLLMIKDAPHEHTEKKRFDLKDVLNHTLRNKNYNLVLLFYILWQVALSISTGFWDVYKMGDLGFNVTTLQIIGVVANVFLILSLRPIGKLADKFSFLWCMRMGSIFAAVVFLLCAFTTPATSWLAIVYTILYGLPSFAIGSNFDNFLLDYTDANYYAYAFALCQTIGGMISFGASVFSGTLLDTIQANGNTLFGIPIYAQQVQAMLSLVCVIALFLLTTFVLNKIPTNRKENEAP